MVNVIDDAIITPRIWATIFKEVVEVPMLSGFLLMLAVENMSVG